MSARLPRLDIDIVHRRARAGDAEMMTITIQAVPGFEAFGRLLEAANPFTYWMRAAEMMRLPWQLAVAQLTQDETGGARSRPVVPRLPPGRGQR